MEASNDENLMSLLRLVRRNWRIVGCCAAIGLFAGIAHFFFADRIYEAEVVAQPAVDAEDTLRDISSLTSRLGAVASLAGLSTSRGSRFDQSVALLTSEGFFANFDHKVGFRSALQRRAEEGLLGSYRDPELMTIHQAHDVFHGRYFRLVKDPTTSVVWLRIRSWDPQLAVVWANELVATLNGIAAEKDLVLADRMLEYLETERGKTERVETKEAIAALIKRETERKMLANVTRDYAFSVIDGARVSDADDFVSPKLTVSVILGLVFGLLMGGAIVVFRQ